MFKYRLLIDKFIDRSISPREREVLQRWVLENEANMTFFKNYLKESIGKTSVDFNADLAYQRFCETVKTKKKAPQVYKGLLKYAAILVVLLSLGFLAKQQFLPNSAESPVKVVEKSRQQPTNNKIIIKLADGTIKELTSEGAEPVVDANGNIVATKGGNSLSFDESRELVGNAGDFHEVFIPFGQTFKLKLSDGTQVWLNSGSKLRFPKNFSRPDKNRMVYLEGEAFFDVTKNKDKPFIVSTQNLDIKVLGTKFNITSFKNEDYIATTLVEGSVSVYETGTPKNSMKLTPNSQAKYNKFRNNFSKAIVDTEIHTAWMQGRLVIDNLKFSEILTRLERSYAVKIINKAESLNEQIYNGEFENEDIESVLKTIALSTPFTYDIAQNVITIKK